MKHWHWQAEPPYYLDGYLIPRREEEEHRLDEKRDGILSLNQSLQARPTSCQQLHTWVLVGVLTCAWLGLMKIPSPGKAPLPRNVPYINYDSRRAQMEANVWHFLGWDL